MSRYTILQINAESYADIRRRIVSIDEKLGLNVYAKEFIRPPFRSHPEMLALDQVHLVALEAEEPKVTGGADLDDHFKGAKLLELVRAFVKDQRISCAETIGQCDHVIVNAYGFIEKLCDVAGYLPSEDD